MVEICDLNGIFSIKLQVTTRTEDWHNAVLTVFSE